MDSEQSDYAHLLPETPLSPEEEKSHPSRSRIGENDIIKNEKPVNVLTILQPELEICTNAVSNVVYVLDYLFYWSISC